MELRWYQSESCDAAWRYVNHHDGNPLIVLPTGAGKSLVIAELIRQVVEWGGRAIVLAHRKELLEQNADKIKTLLPEIDVGLFSAGLNKRDREHDVVVCGIASVFKRACEFGERHVCIVDESHLIPNKKFGMYRQFLSELKQYNQWMRIIGLTATPYRLQDGPLCDGEIFDEVCYSAPIKRLINDGFLSSITTTPTSQVNLSEVSTRCGEFVARELEDAFLRDNLVGRACMEIHSLASDRKSILVFSSGVAHAQAVVQCLESLGNECGLVIGSTLDLERAAILERFKGGDLRCLVNVDVLTTGFDSPNIDCVCVLRATQSAGLFAQMVGRGFRLFPGKSDCLLLDFGQNLARHGPIDDPQYGMHSVKPREQSKGASDRSKVINEKECPNCHLSQDIGHLWCEDCSHKFPEQVVSHDDTPDTNSEVLAKEQIIIEVEGEVVYSRHPGKDGKKDTFRATYGTGLTWPKTVSEWVCIEHDGWPRDRAEEWWSDHCEFQCPETIDDALDFVAMRMLRSPIVVQCEKDGKYWRIVNRIFDRDIPGPEEWVPLAEEKSIDEVPF